MTSTGTSKLPLPRAAQWTIEVPEVAVVHGPNRSGMACFQMDAPGALTGVTASRKHAPTSLTGDGKPVYPSVRPPKVRVYRAEIPPYTGMQNKQSLTWIDGVMMTGVLTLLCCAVFLFS